MRSFSFPQTPYLSWQRPKGRFPLETLWDASLRPRGFCEGVSFSLVCLVQVEKLIFFYTAPTRTYVGQAAVLCKEVIYFVGSLHCTHKAHPLGFGGDVFAYVANAGLFYHFFANTQVFDFHSHCITWANLVSKLYFINCCKEK